MTLYIISVVYANKKEIKALKDTVRKDINRERIINNKLIEEAVNYIVAHVDSRNINLEELRAILGESITVKNRSAKVLQFKHKNR